MNNLMTTWAIFHSVFFLTFLNRFIEIFKVETSSRKITSHIDDTNNSLISVMFS